MKQGMAVLRESRGRAAERGSWGASPEEFGSPERRGVSLKNKSK